MPTTLAQVPGHAPREQDREREFRLAPHWGKQRYAIQGPVEG
ncbi:MAG: hypothetical protein ACOC9T_03730 [Myxococcota bacterium]